MGLPDLPRLDSRERPTTPNWKPTKGTGRRAKAGADRVYRLTRSKFRADIYRLDDGRCRRCHRRLKLKPSQCDHAWQLAHVHEFVWRSHGGDPLDRCNCLVLCLDCHALIHALKVLIVALDETRMMRGPVEFARGPLARVA